MRNIAFVVWMLGWPWLANAYPLSAEEAGKGGAGAIFLGLWLLVGAMTYEAKASNKSLIGG